MKPSKKKSSQVKKDLSVKTTTPRIDNYFKAFAKHFDLEVEEKNAFDETDLKAIYIATFKKKLQGKHSSVRMWNIS